MPNQSFQRADHPRRALTKVLCIDDLFESAILLRRAIDAAPDMHCMGYLASGDNMLDMVRKLQVDVVVVAATVSETVAIDAVRILDNEVPPVRALIYSGREDAAIVTAAIDAGAWGCVCAPRESTEILRAIREIAAGNMWWPSLPQ